ncbi:MAG: C13 family peptidase, partial [Gammaproteobacteria bacterium]|nr:C13 family peptidase [Gammaproteobacteria bacterium]
YAPRHPLLLAVILTLPPALFLIPLWQIWYPYDGDYADGDRAYLDIEATYYQQPALLQQALRELRPERPGITDTYVVGFAGYADQRVFMNEVNYVTDLLEARLDAGGRVLRLVNHPDVVEHVPLANLHNLGVALEAVSDRMDTADDMLFLYMTSHASEEGEFAVQFWPLGLNDITPDELAGALDRSGIRWRILILSGCFTGQFIDALEDPQTLLITAADYDSPSFGCADDRELTWFGEAFFRHAMVEEGETSLEQAFHLARTWIDAREREQDLPPSSPQLRLGAAMAEKLREWSGAAVAD